MPGSRRTANTGSVYKDARGYWCASITLPSPDPTKRRRKVLKRTSRAAVLQAMREAQRELAAVGDLPTASPTMSQWLDLWWARYAKRLKVTTAPSYKSVTENYLRPALGRVRLDKMTPDHIHRLHSYITETKGLSATTALNAHRILSVILRDAVREGRMTRNPATLVDAPRKAIHKVEYLNGDQARRLLASLDPGDGSASLDLARWATALLIGVRQGERLGLTRDAIDLDAGTITISWQLQRLQWQHGCDGTCGRKRGYGCPKRSITIPADQEARQVEGSLHLLRPKSATSWRALPMPSVLTAILSTFLEQHPPAKSGLIFHRDGRPIDPTSDTDDWRAALERAGLPYVGGHSARHTCNTILTELGIGSDVRQLILGHASRAVNEAVYTHTSDARVKAALGYLGGALDWR